MPFPIRLTKRLLALFSLSLPALSGADTVKPVQFGPFFLNQLTVVGSPAGYDYVLTNGFYHFQVGWIEPMSQDNSGLFASTYFETNGNLNVSPYTSDVGTTFNLKPLRYLEMGLSYNRLMFHNSMVSFARPDGSPVDKRLYRPDEIALFAKAPGGADIFTYQANLTFDIGLAQIYLSGARTLWDVDAQGKDFVFEYGDGLLLATRDRVNNVMAQLTFDLRPHSLLPAVSFVGLAVRDQYWITDQTGLEKNLVSAGITGFRLGRNPQQHRRGLDFSIGYWTMHDQIPAGDVAKSIVIIADWQWNIHVLKI